MFSGIVESASSLLALQPGDGVIHLRIERPASFDDLKIGDSIAVNGVCLTVSSLTHSEIEFILGFETLQITGWRESLKTGVKVNMERSLRVGDRVHGHFVSGHVDAMAEIMSSDREGECLLLNLKVPRTLMRLVWTKGSVALNGVSLTVNKVYANKFSVCLIPETLQRTNLAAAKTGDFLTFEADAYAKAVARNSEGSMAGVIL